MTNCLSEWTEAELHDLRIAKSKLEYPSLTAKIADLIGKPIEAGFKLLPRDWNEKVADIAQAALLKGLEFAVRTMGEIEAKRSQDWIHKLLVTSSGVAGGAVGLASVPIELPISTTIILRSIADIARSEGYKVSMLEVKLACLDAPCKCAQSWESDP